MALDVQRVLEEALALPHAERALVATELLASIDDPTEEYSPEAAASFAGELERRIQRITSGESPGIDFETSRRMLDEELAHG